MVGTDIVEIKRIERFLEKFGQKALQKFLSEEEIILAKSVQTIAGFWAAKEAISKALGLGISEQCGFFDIMIYKLKSGAPCFTLSPHLIKKFKITALSLSIAHDGGFAIAIAVIESEIKTEQKLSH
ncbi:MAG: holo-ACP synthase [Campylobacteraceae bacterium]